MENKDYIVIHENDCLSIKFNHGEIWQYKRIEGKKVYQKLSIITLDDDAFDKKKEILRQYLQKLGYTEEEIQICLPKNKEEYIKNVTT